MKEAIIALATRYPKGIMALIGLAVVLATAALPRINIDTDPENMLPADQPDRVQHNAIKKRFGLNDMIVVGITDEDHADGVFNAATLAAIAELSRGIAAIDGVVRRDLMSLSTVDNVTQGDAGAIRFEWLMKNAPQTREAALEIRAAVNRLPLLNNTLVSADGRAAGIYVPIENKHESYRIATTIDKLIAGLNDDAQYYITGLPVAEDTFGVEMFVQMGVSAPLAALVIFLLMWFFFRSLALVIAPMIVAMATVIITMGLLIGSGFTVHIMSSMIPIFLMPIAVVDSVHILSEFADRYRPGENSKTLAGKVVAHLFKPMLFTSITSAVGFASLAFTPIPPVQVFGVFVAIGIALAFLLTVVFVPAYIVLLPQTRLAALTRRGEQRAVRGPLAQALRGTAFISARYSKLWVLFFAALFAVSIWGIQRIQVNDNPVRWFTKNHPIRVADKVLNEHFAGTYNTFLVLTQSGSDSLEQTLRRELATVEAEAGQNGVKLPTVGVEESGVIARLQHLITTLEDRLFDAPPEQVPYLERILLSLEQASEQSRYFQQPEALHYMADLQQALADSGYVGKSNAITDLVKTVYRELRGGDSDYYSIPDQARAVAQTLLSFQGSHRPGDLWHMVTPDYRSAAIWLQLKSGDNLDMVRVLDAVDAFTQRRPLPDGVKIEWGGLTYINVIWQDAMVKGMLGSLVSAFVVVFVMMIALFRSFVFGFLAMLPLTLTIMAIYGLIGFIGKDYDMPIAVLSALTLGLSVDFAIHFIERTRAIHKQTGDWHQTLQQVFEEPARAISRNAIVIAVGFLPLLAAPLIPYRTVGMFLAAIMVLSCVVTLVMLPAAMNLMVKILFKANHVTEPNVECNTEASCEAEFELKGETDPKPKVETEAKVEAGLDSEFEHHIERENKTHEV
ncbi:MAG: efflux RND transporter permease subunit [Exilibacterium sp.]